MKTILTNGLAAAMLAAPPSAVIGAPRADAGNVAQMVKDLKASVDGMRDETMKTAEDALKEARASGSMSAELKAKVDELLPKFNEATTAHAKMQGQLEAIEARAGDIEQVVAQGNGGRNAPRTAGAEVAASDELKAYIAGGLQGGMTVRPSADITRAPGSGGGVTWSERDGDPVQMAQRRLRIRDLLSVVNTGRGYIDYSRQVLRTNNTAPVAEGAPAPKSAYGWEKAQAPVRKIAHHIPVSDEALQDAPELQGMIDTELRYGVELTEETQILTGDGLGENLLGLVTEATAFTASAGLPNTNRIERLRLAMLQVVLADYAADAFVLNPVDWAGIELTKDADGRFIVGSADAVSGTGPTLWRLPVVESNTMTVGTWLTGAMAMAATLYDKQETEVLISSEHGTNFVDGMKTLKAVKRAALAVKRPASLVTGDFTFI